MDTNFTSQIKKWLMADPADRNLLEGAEMLLRLNRNRAMYNTIRRAPARFTGKLEYELRKYLSIRLDRQTSRDIVKMEKRVVPEAQQILSNSQSLGLRPDHGSLPENIKKIWEVNRELRKRIDHLFNEIKARNSGLPCDRYELLKVLDAADRAYRRNFAIYDSYQPGTATDAQAHDVEEVSPQIAMIRRLGAARKTLSKYRKVLKEGNPDEKRAEEARAKIIAACQTIKECGAELSPQTSADLEALGITQIFG